MNKLKSIVQKMTLEEKAGLLSGSGFWHTKAVERLDIPEILLSDGPHGLRIQDGSTDHLGANESLPATCFPTAAATGCSFDRDLLREIGEAIGREARSEELAVVLGPGVNIKRSPLCGRNFEYFSEDPYLTGELASAYIEGVQSQGVGTSLKHFAANNQETARLVNNSIVDVRALREIYLSGFESAVKKSKPWTVMSSYNRLNGTYCSEDRGLLTGILRKEWGFDGAVVTDWGGVSSRVDALSAGTDLEMPHLSDYNDRQILEAVQKGRIKEEVLDTAAENVLRLISRCRDNENQGHPPYLFTPEQHHQLAQRASAASAVLLKNKNSVLPIRSGSEITVLGQLASSCRYQGTGSSRIHPYYLDTPLESLKAAGFQIRYEEGYLLSDEKGKKEEDLLSRALDAAESSQTVLIYAGLPEEWESEGYDRTHLELPENQNRLIEAVSAKHQNVIVVLMCGAPVLIPWKDRVNGILLMYLGGQAAGSACAALVSGESTPGGKLAETWPLALEDTPCCRYFAADTRNTQYRESIFVGYRWYDTARRPVQFPFGYGLSYTTFEVEAQYISDRTYAEGRKIYVHASVKNIGDLPGSEVIQLYIGKKESKIMRARKELKGFEKVSLNPGETKEVEFVLDGRSFSYYHPLEDQWCIEGGTYEICIGTSVDDIVHTYEVEAEGDEKEQTLAEMIKEAPVYFSLPDHGIWEIPEDEFCHVFGRELPLYEGPGCYTIDTPIGELNRRTYGHKTYQKILGQLETALGGKESSLYQMIVTGIDQTPLRSLLMSGVLDDESLHQLIEELNHK